METDGVPLVERLIFWEQKLDGVAGCDGDFGVAGPREGMEGSRAEVEVDWIED